MFNNIPWFRPLFRIHFLSCNTWLPITVFILMIFSSPLLVYILSIRYVCIIIIIFIIIIIIIVNCIMGNCCYYYYHCKVFHSFLCCVDGSQSFFHCPFPILYWPSLPAVPLSFVKSSNHCILNLMLLLFVHWIADNTSGFNSFVFVFSMLEVLLLF